MLNSMKIILFGLCAPMMASAVVTANFTAAENLRFEDDPAFIGNPYDWSGVGRSTSGTFNREWATLLGENYFISAVHYHPTTGETISFAGGNSPSSPVFNYTVAGGFAVPGTDLWIGYTAGAIEPSLKRYSYSTTAANSLSGTGLVGSNLLVSGDNVAGGAGTNADHVVGTNQAESWLESGTNNFTVPGATVQLQSAINFDVLITFENEENDTTNTFTTHESQVQGGDSGGPLFAIVGGDLQLVGIGYAVIPELDGNFIQTDDPDPDESRAASLFSYVGSYESELAATIALVPGAVPEPSALGFLALSVILMKRRR